MKNGILILRIIGGTIIGEISLIVLTTIAQEVLYDGISYIESPMSDIIFGGLATFVAAILAGMIAGLVGGKRNFWPPLLISFIIMIEMTYLISQGITKDPIWFDCLAGFSLIVGIWLGFGMISKLFFKKASAV